jgi:hypothetical protein
MQNKTFVMRYQFIILLLTLVFVSCQPQTKDQVQETEEMPVKTLDFNLFNDASSASPAMKEKIAKYVPFQLKTDISKLADHEKQMIPLLIEAAQAMDECFWYEAYGNKEELLSSINDPAQLNYALVNYGPWDRLDNNQAFIDGAGKKPKGANFYPHEMTKELFEQAEIENKMSLYNFIRTKDDSSFYSVPYHVQFKEQHGKAAGLLKEAAMLAQNEGLKKYLNLRAEALLNDVYQASDMAWLDMKTNHLDIVIGPIENYEDQLFGYKAAHECYVLVKDMDWSKRLEKYGAFLPDLQKGLPVADAYKQETPGTDTELNAYDVIYYAGDCNAGSKTIAINLPNDEQVQLEKGTRRLQLKNAMQAKFDKILVPISEMLIDPEQRKHITFNAFFSNTMFHEVAHGLGIKNTINGKGTVRKALQEHASALEEGKADILGLYMVKQLFDRGELEGDMMDYYVTFMTSIFRSVRFGASSAHGKANMIRFNYFKEAGAFENFGDTGMYRINADRMEAATKGLSELILKLQGDGDYTGVDALVKAKGLINIDLQADLDRLSAQGIPVDIIFEQGGEVLGI